jgi:site-specific DNA-methyltransferase (adenine-specific)
LDWLKSQPEDTYHAVVTDPPFGLEYESEHLEKLRGSTGGAWRVPREGRKAVPRFTELSLQDLTRIESFFTELAPELLRVLRPGGHLVMASNPLVSPWMFGPFNRVFERRGVIIRLVQTLRGGDRPKGAETEYEDITVMPRSAYEPWGLFRKPLSERTVALNLDRWQTGALKRLDSDTPFTDVISSGFPTKEEREISNHPSLKPQSWLRPLVRALLPRGGVLLDPFMGSGSTIAAAKALGFDAVGVERDPQFYREAPKSIEALVAISDDLCERDIFDSIHGYGHSI